MAAYRAGEAEAGAVAPDYRIEVTAEESGKAGAVSGSHRRGDGSMAIQRGFYCLRSSEAEWDEDVLWRTYTSVTGVEAVFRWLESELRLRLSYHRKARRADGQVLITIIAYELVQVIGSGLRAHGDAAGWTTARCIVGGQQHVSAKFPRSNGRTLRVRTGTQAEHEQRDIYDALGVDPDPGGVVRKTLI